MKIVYCIQGMYKSGGIERVVSMKANYLVQHGYDVTIITTDQEDRPYFFPIDERVKRIDLGLDYGKLDHLPSYKRLWRTRLKRKEHKALLEQTLKHEQADICISVGFQDEDILPSLRDGSRKILESHSSRLTPILMYPKEQRLKRWLGKIRIKLKELSASRYDCYVILTEEERAEYHNLKNLQVIPNPSPLNQTIKSALETHRIIAVGRMEYQKNFPELLRIWSRIASDFPDWMLHIYGDGWMLNGLKQQAVELGIASQVTFEGAVSDMETAYASSSIYLMTSHFEGLPMVLLEAQSVGLPAVSYACSSGPRDIITDGEDGFLVPLYDEATFAERLSTLMRDEALRTRMSKAAEVASHRYDLEVIMPQWLNLFNTLNASAR